MGKPKHLSYSANSHAEMATLLGNLSDHRDQVYNMAAWVMSTVSVECPLVLVPHHDKMPFTDAAPLSLQANCTHRPAAAQQCSYSGPADSKLLLSLPHHALCSQPPAKLTLLEISLQITQCLLDPLGSRGNQKPQAPPPPSAERRY